MRVLVTGAGGQLGLDLLDAFGDVEVVGLGHAELDVADRDAVTAAVSGIAPEVVINAAAWTAVDACEADEDRAHRSNALGPWWLAQACDRLGATLVQVSTDYVFSGPAPLGAGGQPRGWSEFDPIAPANAYGRSKAAGETLVRQTLERHHIVRTAWVSGARGQNFVQTMLRLGRERDQVSVVTDQYGSPTATRDLAAAIRELVDSGSYGTINRTGTGSCSWYDLAVAVFELADVEVEVAPTTSADFQRPAPRPAWSVLDDRHARTQGLTALPHWRDGLARLLEELAADGKA